MTPSEIAAKLKALRLVDVDIDLLTTEWVQFRTSSTPRMNFRQPFNKSGAEIDVIIARMAVNIKTALEEAMPSLEHLKKEIEAEKQMLENDRQDKMKELGHPLPYFYASKISELNWVLTLIEKESR